MRLSEMKPGKLWQELERYMAPLGWDDMYVQQVRKELKRKCEKLAVVRHASDQIMVGPDGNLIGWFDHETGHFHTPSGETVLGEALGGKTEMGYPTGALFQGFEILLKSSDCWNSDYEHAKSRFNQMYCDWISSQPGAGVRPAVERKTPPHPGDVCPTCFHVGMQVERMNSRRWTAWLCGLCGTTWRTNRKSGVRDDIRGHPNAKRVTRK